MTTAKWHGPLHQVPGLDLRDVRRTVDACLDRFLTAKSRTAAQNGLPVEPVELLRGFLLAGGKRLRPLLCVCGWQAAGGGPATGPVVRTAAALEMFHAFALIHDDVMDRSEIRRGQPTVHRAVAARHQAGRETTAAEYLGSGAGILIGDLALTWSGELVHTSGLIADRLTAVLPVIDAMRAEVMYGQYLDLTAAGQPTTDVDRALTINRFKTAKYTVEHPLHIGAILAGADTATLAALSAYALPLGEAFQLRDDLLGTFGDDAVTGKPVGDDLREGKHSVLMALALRSADRDQVAALLSLINRPLIETDDLARARTVLETTGARAHVENMISVRQRQALDVLEKHRLPEQAVAALRQLVAIVTAPLSDGSTSVVRDTARS